MSKRAMVLGGIHIHQLFKLPRATSGMNIHKIAELAYTNLLQHPELILILWILNILCIDKLGQFSSELLAILDMLLRIIRNNNIFFGGLKINGNIDHKQISAIQGHPFLTSPHILTCFTMCVLKHSVRASSDTNLQRIIEITRMHPDEYNPSILQEFANLASDTFTFVPSWNHEIITPDVFRIFLKKIPAQACMANYIDQVCQRLTPEEYIMRSSEDTQKRITSQSEWINASNYTQKILNKKVKEQPLILFFVGALFEFTQNEAGKFSQSQLCLLLELPTNEDIQEFCRIKVMVAPPGLKEFFYEGITDNNYYIQRGWKIELLGVAHTYEIPIPGGMKAIRKQYKVKHHVTSTVHACQGDTLHRVATEISYTNKNFTLWDKGQVVVLLSRTREGKHVIFVGSKVDTIRCLISLIQVKSQWMDYMEKVISLVSINNRTQIDSPLIPIFDYSSISFEFNQLPLPQCNTGYVYFIVSVRNKRAYYIGETMCLKTRLRQHNSGSGTFFMNKIGRRPWALFAYITGFDKKRNLMKSVENSWQKLCHDAVSDGVRSMKEIASTASLITENSYRNELRFISHFNEAD